ncbi:MAG TPA: choice-of-anchor D domain-containing protein [Saprospiraceae bacterium]|nr:choice-of-anchor D domain-containing protein [Saprospiraceae bacterium]
MLRQKQIIIIFLLLIFNICSSQISITNTSVITEDFNSMGATLNLPSNWRIRGTTWAAGSSTVGQQASSGSPTAGATYNWGENGSTDRAVGAMTSGSFSSPNQLMVYFRNLNANDLETFVVEYTAERYRINSAAASVEFFYSTNGTSWTAVPSGNTAAFSTGSSSYTFANPTKQTISNIQITGLNIPTNGDIYLRWNVLTTGASSQGIGIDDISIIPTFSTGCTSPTTPPSAFSASNIGTTSMDIAWTNGNGDNTLVVARAGSAVNADPMSGSTYTADASFGNGSQIGTGNYVVYNGTGSTVSVSNLTSSTTYHYAIYSYNSVDNCYNLTELIGNATTTGPELQLQYPGTNNVACGFTLPFGNVNINNTSDLSYNIKNEGTSNLEVSSLDITGTDGGLYTIVSSHSFPITITPGNTEIVTVRFAPTTGGSKNATLTIENNDSNEDPCTVILSGTAIVPPAYYRTKQSGLWTSASTWETSLDNISWIDATSAPTVNDFDVSIRTPHNITISTSLTIDQTIIEAGSVLEVTANVTLENGTGDDLQVFGILRSSASITTTGNVVVKSGGVYQHNVATGSTRIPLSTWETGSTCEVIGYTTGGGLSNAGFDQNFYNFTWNCPLQTSEQNLSGTLTSIGGDFTVQSTGSSNLRLIGVASTLIVGGNLTVNMGAILNMSGSGSLSRIDVTGNVSIDGTINELGTGSGLIVFKGNTQSFSVTGNITNTVNFTIDNGSIVDVLTNISLPNNLTLTSGLIRLNNNNLTVLGNIVGGSSTSYIQTNGLGLLKQNVSATKLFPIGNSTYNQINLSIANLTEIGVRVLDGVYTSGLMGSAITEKVVNRTWDINATITNPLTLQVFWSISDEAVDFDRNACYVSHYTGGAWEGETPGIASGSGPYSLSRVTTSLSPFAVGSLGVLPVEFSNFSVTKKNKSSILSFATASETNNDYFSIERSADGTSFDAIGEIKGAGNSNTSVSYEFTDEKPLAGINYYRIKQTDFDGKFSYTDIKSVRHNTYGNLNITPRTTEGRLQITTDAEDYSIDVYNVAGQQVKSYPSLSLDQTISIDELTAGLYYIKVNVDGQVETTKIAKL